MMIVRKIFNKSGIMIVALIMFLFFSIASVHFFTLNNILSIIQQSAINLVIALGMSFVIATGGIDLSVGSIVAFSSVVMADLIKYREWPILLAILLTFIVGTMAGTLNGLMISKLNLQPFIVTLASTTCLRGLALVYTGGYPIYELPEEFIKIFAGKVGNIPIMVFWAFVCTVICVFIMRKTRFGEYVLAIGGNEEAARICGVNTGKIKLIVYGMSGLMSTIGALMLAARLNAAEPSSGVSYELNAIAAVVMGGASLSGGKANMLGTVIGALILSMLANGLTLLNIQSYYQQVVTGIVIIVAVILDKRRV